MIKSETTPLGIINDVLTLDKKGYSESNFDSQTLKFSKYRPLTASINA
jgi:hypothetical protein